MSHTVTFKPCLLKPSSRSPASSLLLMGPHLSGRQKALSSQADISNPPGWPHISVTFFSVLSHYGDCRPHVGWSYLCYLTTHFPQLRKRQFCRVLTVCWVWWVFLLFCVELDRNLALNSLSPELAEEIKKLVCNYSTSAFFEQNWLVLSLLSEPILLEPRIKNGCGMTFENQHHHHP